MDFTERITIEEQKKLSSDDQKDYLKFLFAKEGNMDEVKALEDSNFLLPTGGGADPADNPGALPPGETKITPPPGSQAVTEDHSDLPPSVRGELGSLEDIPAEVAAEVEVVEEVAAPAEEDPAEEKEAPSEEPPPYLKVNEHTTYKTQEEAIKGIDEKDRTIQNRDEELRLAKQENELLTRESESYKIRMEAEQRHAELSPPPAQEVAEVKPDEVVTPPTSDELYAIWDDTEKGPLEALKLMMPHAIQDLGLNKLIDLAARLDHLKADEFIEKLQVMGTTEIMQSFQEDFIYGNIDEKFPEFEGKWRDPKDPIGIQYMNKFHEIDESYTERVGAPLRDIAERSPESVQWVIAEVLSRMDAPSNNGDSPGAPATTETPAPLTDPPHTDGTETGEPERRFTRAEAEAIASKTADLAVKAVTARNKLHGQVQTESAGAKKSQPVATRKEWTKEAIQKDPMGWAKARKSDPNFQKATLDMLPQVRE